MRKLVPQRSTTQPAAGDRTGTDRTVVAWRGDASGIQNAGRHGRHRWRPRRDRRGRGLRGPLAPPQVPIIRSRADLFDDLVDESVQRLERRWAAQLREVEFAVAEVPLDESADSAGEPVPLARIVPPVPASPPRIVVYRRPLEARAVDREELGLLVHDVVVEQVAELLGLEPESVDPRYGQDGPNG